ncbi:MAG: thiamine-phosphate kinase, partial [Armatimonadetes bacterium]|nr:thiamine-phosphate kinase [Armatimonadota bacterium]
VLRERMTPEQVGRRAVAVSLSDIAAMGGEPRYALVSLLLPPAVEVRWVDRLYDGLAWEAGRWAVTLAGGNISRTSGPLAIDVLTLGEVESSYVLRRTGARPGDALLVSGDLGRAAAGLHLLRSGHAGSLVDAYVTPTPRLAAARAIARSGLAHAMLDLSDGLASDLQRLGEESGVGALVEARQLPISVEVREAATSLGLGVLALAISGGEDFELLVAAPPEHVEALSAAVRVTGIPLTRIGEVRPPQEGIAIRHEDGAVRPLRDGWDHFPGRPA